MNTPEHVAIILDGNRTWARENGLSAFKGHTQGAKNIERITKFAIEKNVKFLTLYTLSTENIRKRSKREISHLFRLFEKISDYEELYQKNNIRFCIIGDLTALPRNVSEAITYLLAKTKLNTGITLTFAINYGGRDEIIRAIQKLEDSAQVTESSFTQALDTAMIPDVDLLIRTGGYQRLSNFLPWQSTYAELYFTEKKWPEFSPIDFEEAILWFQQQKRKHGS